MTELPVFQYYFTVFILFSIFSIHILNSKNDSTIDFIIET